MEPIMQPLQQARCLFTQVVVMLQEHPSSLPLGTWWALLRPQDSVIHMQHLWKPLLLVPPLRPLH